MIGDSVTISRIMEEMVRLEQRSLMLDRLLFAVQRVFDGETRFETALRYIRGAEVQANTCGMAQKEGPSA